MDFWLIASRLLRRWYLTLPLLGATAVLAAVVTSSVKSSYEVETQVLLVPAGQAGAPGNPLLLATRNQLDAATQSLLLVLDSPARAAERTEEHPGASVQFSTIEEAPIVVLSVEAVDPDTAREGASFSSEQLNDALRDIEAPLGTAPDQRLETVPLAPPTVVQDTGDRPRVFIGVYIAGMLATSLLVLAADRLLRRRLERRLTSDLDREVGTLGRGFVPTGSHHRSV